MFPKEILIVTSLQQNISKRGGDGDGDGGGCDGRHIGVGDAGSDAGSDDPIKCLRNLSGLICVNGPVGTKK